MTGMIQDHHLHALQDFDSPGASMSGICYVIAKQYWAAWGLSESVVFHVVSWVSFRVVLVWFLLGCCLLLLCLCWLKTPSFLLSPILQHVGIANQRLNVLMTVWASSAHGMSSKKIESVWILEHKIWTKVFRTLMVVFTSLVVRQFMTKTCKKIIYTNNNNPHIHELSLSGSLILQSVRVFWSGHTIWFHTMEF